MFSVRALRRKNRRSFRICIRGRPWQEHHMILVTSLLSKYCVYKMFSVHAGMRGIMTEMLHLVDNRTVYLP